MYCRRTNPPARGRGEAMSECSTCTTIDDLRETRERAGNLSVELAAMTLERDTLRQALDRAERERDQKEDAR